MNVSNRPDPIHSKGSWIALSWWPIGIAILATVAFFGILRIEKDFLWEDAQQTALGYAEHLVRVVPDLNLLLDNGELSKEANAALQRERQLGNVFRFKLFDSEGVLLIISDDLDEPDPVAVRKLILGVDHQNETVRDIVLGGESFIELEDGRDNESRPDWYSEAYVPMFVDNKIIGVIEVYVDQTERRARIGAAFWKVAALVGVLLLIGVIALAFQIHRHITAQRRSANKIRFLAEHDSLSETLNRRSFERVLIDAIKTARQRDQRFAVHCIDIDRFKEVNDTMGHAAGDEVLREVARRLKSLCKSEDSIARIGGDEFAMLQSQVPSDSAVERCGQSIVELLEHPIEYQGRKLPGGVSVGAAIYGTDATDPDALLHRADLAMYRSKATGRGRFSFYDPAMDQLLEERRLLALDLRTSLADDVMELHYQPLFDCNNSKCATGYEALMRWQHPTRGTISPAVFIPLAEEIGQIEALGTWAIRKACEDAMGWPDDVRVAVNLSSEQFREGATDVVAVVTDALQHSGLAPHRLELEITESLLMQDSDGVLDSLQRLTDLGVRLAMDDFGTGYSSLSYLWRFPFNKVKIDRAFASEVTEDKRVETIVSSIVSMAHSLGMRVNVEGIETHAQQQKLVSLGCDELQGFLLGKPEAIEKPEAMKKAG